MPRAFKAGPDAALDAVLLDIGIPKVAAAMGLTEAAVFAWHRRGFVPSGQKQRFHEVVAALRLLQDAPK